MSNNVIYFLQDLRVCLLFVFITNKVDWAMWVRYVRKPNKFLLDQSTLMRLYLLDFFIFYPKAVLQNLFLNLAAAATEGLGLMMLLPLLSLAGVGRGEQNVFFGLSILIDLITALVIFVGLIVLQSGLVLLKPEFVIRRL